jgi:pSer/pThr/pTyr-binding forkhead associated (FHA) protein
MTTLRGRRRNDMRLFVSLGGSSVNEIRFDRGPIYVGRQIGSQVFLPDQAVSRQHAVLYTTREGIWIIEDLGSSNKTYLNEKAIHKNELKHGDKIRIADFTIQVSLEEDDLDVNRMAHLEDTVVGETVRKELHTVERNMDSIDAPPIKFPAKRIKQLCQAMEKISSTNNLNHLYAVLSDLLLSQFRALNVWIGLRKAPTGPLDVQGGRKINTEAIQRIDLALPSSLAEVQETKLPQLVHQMPRQIANRGIRSVLIAPILHEGSDHGIIYLENAIEHSHYSLSDLDYLIIISVFVGCYISRHCKHETP